MMSEISQSKVGRPRRIADAEPGTSPRDQILAAAASLFVRLGFASTSTRAIAEAVGMRQASLYYYFAGKDEILSELLDESVRPSAEFARSVSLISPDQLPPAAALYALAIVDVGTLTNTPHNTGMLYLLPETQDERHHAFHAVRAELQAVYGRLGMLACAVPREVRPFDSEEMVGAMLIQLVEVVIQLRRTESGANIDAVTIASSCLRMLGLPESDITESQRSFLLLGKQEHELA